MQLRQKYTIDNITYENELFINEKDSVNVTAIMEYFFNMQKERNKKEILHGLQASVQNNTAVIDCHTKLASAVILKKPVTEESKPCHSEQSEESEINKYKLETQQTVKTEKEYINNEIKTNTRPKEGNNEAGYYIKYRIGNNIIERWSRVSTEANAKAIIYNYVSKLKKEYGCEVEYEFLEIKPMTKEEFDNRNKSAE